jgi:hypothetical protein
LRRLWLARVVFAGFSLTWVLVYRRLEGLGWQDALFWMIQPHAIDGQRVHHATKLFSRFVYVECLRFRSEWRSRSRSRSSTGKGHLNLE